MLLKIKRFLKRIFSKQFTHPVVNEKLSTAIDDKLAKRLRDAQEETRAHQDTLNSYLKTYFSKPYETPELMQVAFTITNKKWVELCRNVNGRSKLINLDKDAFKKRVELTIKYFNEKQKQDGIHN